MKKYRVTVNGTVYEVELYRLRPRFRPGGSRRCPRTCRACRTGCR